MSKHLSANIRVVIKKYNPSIFRDSEKEGFFEVRAENYYYFKVIKRAVSNRYNPFFILIINRYTDVILVRSIYFCK